MISHYEHPLYDKMLKGWNKEKKTVRYHRRTTEECIYYNYPKPSVLQTYEYIGNDCWDRQRITRKINRLSEKLLSLPELECNAVIQRVSDIIHTKSSVVPGIELSGTTVKNNCSGRNKK
jgi:hypothetical protein